MAPKAKNVVGSKRSRKGKAFGFGNREPIQKFGKKTVERGKDLKFNAMILHEFLGTPNCDSDDFNALKDKPPYRDIQHTLCGVESTARWERSKDTGRHNTLYFANFNQVARVWSLITRFLRARGIEEEVMDLTIAFHPNLMGKLVDVTQTKALDTSYGPVLSAQERQTRADSVMERMFDMVELQLRIRGRSVTYEEMENLADRYLLTESAPSLHRTGPAFLEPLDDDEATAYKVINDEEDDADDEEKSLNVQYVEQQFRSNIYHLRMSTDPHKDDRDGSNAIAYILEKSCAND
ncbi:hypothetical protein H5410_005275 [Solanum commersonii]|uniref:Uncharacterized protein n=1 Tax=Solanum commersonii TaxID=4109 RepID=A0A9J6A684_SOLCO|nr:hypothetical protein H5410_005275 [Solanum commersonii]